MSTSSEGSVGGAMRSGGGSRVRHGLAVAVLAAVAGACYQHTYTIGSGAPAGTLVYDEWRHHWLGGLIDPDSELVLSELCPSGHATIESEMTFLNGLVGALTSGIYTPTTVRVRCSDTSAELPLHLDAEDVRRIVSHPRFLQWVGAMAPDRLTDARAARLDHAAD